MTTASRANVWCALKPILACGLVERLALDGYGPTAVLGDLLSPERLAEAGPAARRVEGARVIDLLDHAVPLPDVGLLEARVWGDERVERSWDRIAHGDRRPGTQDYAEYAGWFLLEQLAVDRGYDLASERPAVSDASEIACAYAPLGETWAPLVHDLLPAFWTRPPIVFGGFMAARDLAGWYAGCLAGGVRQAWAAQVAAAASGACRWYSPVLLRTVSFALGCQVDIGSFLGVRGLTPAAFGHVGWSGASVGLADPDAGIAVAVVLNTLDVGHDRFFRARTELIEWAIRAARSRRPSP